MTTVTFLIGPNPPSRLDKALGRDVPEDAALSRSRLVRLIDEGAVTIDGATVTDPRFRAAEGAQVVVSLTEADDSHIAGEDIPLDVVFEDDALIVINKPAGMVVHPAPGTPSGTMVNALIHHCGDSLSGVGGQKRPGVVHRIDKDTSGLIVAAKTDKAHHHLADQFARHSVTRRYIAVCYGVPSASDPRLRGIKGTAFEPGAIMRVQSFLGRHRTDRQKQAVSFDKGKYAVTRVHVVKTFGKPPAAALVECWLETGRTHQIRVHLAHCGHGLIGDPVYGGKRKISIRAVGTEGQAAASEFPRQALHAATLGFDHPIHGTYVQFSESAPEDMRELMRNLEGMG